MLVMSLFTPFLTCYVGSLERRESRDRPAGPWPGAPGVACPQSRYLLGDAASDSSLPSGHSERRERITHGAAMSSTLAWNTKTCLPQLEKTNVGTGLHGRLCSSLQLCPSFHAWSLLTKTQHAWLRCSSPRECPLSLGARWDLPCRMDYLAVHNSP